MRTLRSILQCTLSISGLLQTAATILFAAAAIFFAVSVAKLHSTFGIWALLTACNGFWLLFFWSPWPAILIFIPSTYLLFKASRNQ